MSAEYAVDENSNISTPLLRNKPQSINPNVARINCKQYKCSFIIIITLIIFIYSSFISSPQKNQPTTITASQNNENILTPNAKTRGKGKGGTIIIIPKSSSSSSSEEEPRPSPYPSNPPTAKSSMYRFDIDVEIIISSGTTFNQATVKQNVETLLHNLNLNNAFLVAVETHPVNTSTSTHINTQDDHDMVEIRIDIYTFNEADMLAIRVYMQSDAFEHEIQNVIHEPANAGTGQGAAMGINVGVTDTQAAYNEENYSYLQWLIPLLFGFCIIIGISVYACRYYRHKYLKIAAASADEGPVPVHTDDVWQEIPDQVNHKLDHILDETDSAGSGSGSGIVVGVTLHNFENDYVDEQIDEKSDDSEIENENENESDQLQAFVNENNNNFNDELEQSQLEADLEEKNEGMSAEQSTGFEAQQTQMLFKQISAMLMLYEQYDIKNESEMKSDDVSLEISEHKNDENDDEALPLITNQSGEFNEKEFEMEWAKQAKQILEAHEKQEMNKKQIERARRLLMEKKNMKMKVRKSVVERRELLKLAKNKLAKQCRDYGVAVKGSKTEIVDRLLQKKKALSKKKKEKGKKIMENIDVLKNNDDSSQFEKESFAE